MNSSWIHKHDLDPMNWKLLSIPTASDLDRVSALQKELPPSPSLWCRMLLAQESEKLQQYPGEGGAVSDPPAAPASDASQYLSDKVCELQKQLLNLLS